MGLVEAVQVVAIAATAVVTYAAIDEALACHWLGRQARDRAPRADRATASRFSQRTGLDGTAP